MSERTFEARKENLLKAFNRQNPQWVPILMNGANGLASYAGKTHLEAMESPESFAAAMSRIFDDLYADCYIDMAPQTTPKVAQLFRNTNLIRYAPDGTSVEHHARSVMRADDYPALIADPAGFRKNVIIPRMYPFLFTEGIESAKEVFQRYAEEMKYLGELGATLNDCLENKYKMVNISAFDLMGDAPLDWIFDFYRGFKDTVLDLRRRKAQVRAAVESIWETCDHFEEVGEDYRLVQYAPHIPTYLSTKDFEELYWPYYKAQIEALARHGRKAYIITEGKWDRFLPYFREVPQDSCVLQIDDDDVMEAYDAIGDWQIIAGGSKLASLILKNSDQCIDEAKRVIEHCAPGGAFIFTTDKSLNGPCDVNRNVVEVYNYVHEHY